MGGDPQSGSLACTGAAVSVGRTVVLLALMGGASELQAACDPALTFKAYVHVIHRPGAQKFTQRNGYLDHDVIKAAFRLLNTAYAPEVCFELQPIDPMPDEREQWIIRSRDDRSLRSGFSVDPRALHVFTVPGLELTRSRRKKGRPVGHGTAFATESCAPGAKPAKGVDCSHDLDRVLIVAARLNADPAAATLIHEVAHWSGLWHVFGPCDIDDEVQDTAHSKQSASEPVDCALLWLEPTEMETCDNRPALLLNYMNYTGMCREAFSPGQKTRMVDRLRRARPLPP